MIVSCSGIKLSNIDVLVRIRIGGTPAVAQWDQRHLWSHLDVGSIPDPAQWVRDPALPQLRLRSQLWL